MKPGFPIGFATICVLFMALSPATVRAQSDEPTVEREIKFIRGLAKDWGFIDLAQTELEKLQRSTQSDASLQKRLGQVDAEVLYLAARRIPDLDERQKVLRSALQKFEDYLTEFGRTDGYVLATVARACEEYGQFLAQGIGLTEDPDKRKALEDEALDVFTKGIRSCNEAMNVLEPQKDKTTKAKVEYYLTWLRKGTLLRQWAKTIERDREVKAKEAYGALENMVLEIGEGTPLGLTGLLEMAVTQDVMGHTDDALMLFEGTIDQVYDRLKDQDNPVSANTALLMFQILEKTYMNLTAVYLREGKIADTQKAVASYLSKAKELQFSSTPNFGDRLLLNGTQADLDSGNQKLVNSALTTAREIRGRHPADFIGVRASKLIKTALTFEGAQVNAEALFQAAMGDYQGNRYAQSISGFKRVLRELGNDKDKAAFGMKAFTQIGRALDKMGRYLEAYYALEHGLATYGRLDEDSASSAADLLLKVAQKKNREVKDGTFDALEKKALNKTIQFSSHDAGKALWTKAMNEMSSKNYDGAVATLARIKPDNYRFELAKARAGVALYRADKKEAALAAFKDYRKYTTDSFNQLRPDQTMKVQARENALAESEFYIGQIYADEGFATDKKPANPAILKKLVDQFKGYRERFGRTAEVYAVRADYHLIRAYIELERLADAEAAYRSLRKAFPKRPEIANLAVELFYARRRVVEARKTEVAALKKAKNKKGLDAAIQALNKEMRETLNFAKEYMALERRPSYPVLRHASQIAEELGAHDEAEIYLEKILELYSSDPKLQVGVFIKPELAEIKLAKHDYNQALKLIDDAIKARTKPEDKASGKVSGAALPLLRVKARALGGWSELDHDLRLKIYNGLQKYKEAYEIMWMQYRNYVVAKYKPFTFGWYQFYYDCMDLALKVAGTGNTDFQRIAKKFYDSAKSVDDFKTLENLGEDGVDLHRLYLRRKMPGW